MEEFLRHLGINGDFNIDKDGNLVMDIVDSNQYGVIYSKLDRCDELEIDDYVNNTTYTGSTIQFNGDNYVITLVGDMEADTYKLIMKEL